MAVEVVALESAVAAVAAVAATAVAVWARAVGPGCRPAAAWMRPTRRRSSSKRRWRQRQTSDRRRVLRVD